MLALKLAMRLLLSLGLFQRHELGLGQDQAFLGALGLQCFEPLVHGLEVMTLPHAAHAGGRDREPALAQFVGDADLTEGRLLDGQRNDGIFDLLCDAILQYRLLAADLLQRQLAAFVIEFLKAVEAVAAIAHHLAGLADMPSCLASSRSPTLARMIFCSVVMWCPPIRRGGALRHPDRSAPRLGLRFAVGSRTPHVRLNLS